MKFLVFMLLSFSLVSCSTNLINDLDATNNDPILQETIPEVTPETPPEEPTPPDNSMSKVQFSEGSIEPAFQPNVYSYVLHVGLMCNSIALETTTADPLATVAITGENSSELDANAIPLTIGNNTIKITVSVPSLNNDSVYTFIIDRSITRMQTYIKPDAQMQNSLMGVSTAYSNDLLAVGLPGESNNTFGINSTEENYNLNFSGAVYIYKRTDNSWTKEAYIKADQPDMGDYFGVSIALSDNTLAVGASFESGGTNAIVHGPRTTLPDNTKTQSGAVYVFVKENDVWKQQAFIKPNFSSMEDYFGFEVSLYGDLLVVSAPQDSSTSPGIGADPTKIDDPANIKSGAVYIFKRTNGIWAQQAYIKTPDPSNYDRLGERLSLYENTLAVGCVCDDHGHRGVVNNTGSFDFNDNSSNCRGAVYLYEQTNDQWNLSAFIKASNGRSDDTFGCTVGLHKDTLVVGAPLHCPDNTVGLDSACATGNEHYRQGAAYVYEKTDGTWAEKAILTASNGHPLDRFGNVTSISNDVIAINSLDEPNSNGGINPYQFDEGAFASGAVYLFYKNQDTWQEYVYIKTQNPRENDYFGGSLTFSPYGIIISAPQEDGSATGFNGNYNYDNPATENSGALFLYQ